MNDNILCIVGALALGVSLFQIHIYVTPLKRMLQIFWALGMAGSAWLMTGPCLDDATPSPSIINFVVHNPWSVWCIGPLFAALTGVTFKEGLCYGKPEAFVLTILVPLLLLGHLSGLGGEGVDKGLVTTVAILLLIFATRKYTQPVKDDIGDGSVFNFNKMTEAEQRALLESLEER